jgi:hypothetical protein
VCQSLVAFFRDARDFLELWHVATGCRTRLPNKPTCSEDDGTQANARPRKSTLGSARSSLLAVRSEFFSLTTASQFLSFNSSVFTSLRMVPRGGTVESTALKAFASVPFGFVLVRVRIRVRGKRTLRFTNGEHMNLLIPFYFTRPN